MKIPTTYKVPVFVLAGKSPASKIIGEEANNLAVDNKALIKFNNESMLERVVKSFLEAERIGDVYVCASKDEARGIWNSLSKEVRASEGVHLISSNEEYIDKVLEKAFKSIGLADEKYALISSSDTPLLNHEHINSFIEKVFEQAGYDVIVPYTTIQLIEEKYPGLKRRKMADLVTNDYSPEKIISQDEKLHGIRTANMFLVNKKFVDDYSQIIRFLFDERKGGLYPIVKDMLFRMIKKLDFNTIVNLGLKFVNKKLSIEDVEYLVEKTYGIFGRGVCVEPEFCIDVDYKEHYDDLVRWLDEHSN